MRLTQFLRTANQAVAQSETSRLVTEAARRAADKQPRRRWRLRDYNDLIVVSVAAVVAISSYRSRRAQDEKLDLINAHLQRVTDQRDHVQQRLVDSRRRLHEEASDAVKLIIETPSRSRVDTLRAWVDRCLPTDEQLELDPVEKEKEFMV